MIHRVPNTTSGDPYCPPEKIMTPKEYRAAVDALANEKDCVADSEYLKKIDKLASDLKDMILYNSDDVSCGGTAYYVKADGDDNADGLSPETAWATLDKVNSFEFKEGDGVYFKRGDIFRGKIDIKSGLTYSSYGLGRKPRIFYAFDGRTFGKWIRTDMENIWKLDTPIPDVDVCNIVFNNGQSFGDKKYYITELKENGDFTLNNYRTDDLPSDNKIYMYCDLGNPAEVYEAINIARNSTCARAENSPHDVLIHNIEFAYGSGAVWVNRSRNIKVSYCVFGWSGGKYFGKESLLRYGGGGGCWHSCDNYVWDHCYLYQQLDSGVTPQYHWIEKDPAVFKDFITRDCLFETIEWTLEFFTTQKTTEEHLFKNMYFGYNFCRLGGYGFGKKSVDSAYIKSWQNHSNYSEDCVIEKNIFDRPFAKTIAIAAQDHHGKPSYSQLPKFKNNIYIDKKGKQFALVNGIYYAFDEQSKEDFEELGFEEGAVYKYIK